MNKFLDRLNQIVQKRKKHPWGESLGIARGTVDNMFKGNIPTSEALSAISRVENVSLTWLLEGRGAPYMVACPADDAEACDILEELLLEGGWAAHVLSHDDNHVIVLTKPGSFQHKGKPEVHYTIVEIIAGQFSDETIILLRLGRCVSRCQLHVSRDTIKRLRQGKMSNLELIGWKGSAGILSDCPTSIKMEDIEPYQGTNSLPKIALVKDPDAGENICNNVVKLSREHRQVAEATVKELLKIEGKEWKDGC